MNMILKQFLSMSCSGALLILALFSGRRFVKDKISRQWQYYIWLIVIMRLLLPFETEINLMGKIYQRIDQAITRENSMPQTLPAVIQKSDFIDGRDQHTADSAEALMTVHPFREMMSLLTGHIWLVWLAAALGMLIRKVTVYQSFVQYINSGSTPVTDIDILDRLSMTAEQMGIRRPVELYVNPQISSPLLKGFFHPCIVLPGVDVSEKDFQYIMLHELIHYKRKDMFYKWLVQATICLHWFNPLVYLMSREIARACEFSCDEAVLIKMRYENPEDYGKTLLDAMAAVGKHKDSLGAVTLSENKKILKERLTAIMNFKRKSRAIHILTGMLTLCIISGTFILGGYSAEAAPDQMRGNSLASNLNKEDILSAQERTEAHTEAASSQAERYYEADSLPLFQIVFSRLNEKEQLAWLEKIYADGSVAFFSIAAEAFEGNDPLLDSFAEKAYADGEIGFFSVLTDYMDEEKLEVWLDRALEDDHWNFQSVLFDRLEVDDEKDVQEEKWEEQQLSEYQAVGVTKDGKIYYYQGQMVNIFLDIRPDKAFYTLDMNPAGTVNIRIIRGEDGKITGAACMDEEETVELLGDMSAPDDL